MYQYEVNAHINYYRHAQNYIYIYIYILLLYIFFKKFYVRKGKPHVGDHVALPCGILLE